MAFTTLIDEWGKRGELGKATGLLQTMRDDELFYYAKEPGNGGSRRIYWVEDIIGEPVFHKHDDALFEIPTGLFTKSVLDFVAIDEQTATNGPLKLLKGSHRMGRVDHWSKDEQQGADLERVAMAKARVYIWHNHAFLIW